MGDTASSAPHPAQDSDHGSGSTTTVASPQGLSASAEDTRPVSVHHEDSDVPAQDLNQNLHDSILTPRANESANRPAMAAQAPTDYFTTAAVRSHSVVDVSNRVSNTSTDEDITNLRKEHARPGPLTSGYSYYDDAHPDPPLHVPKDGSVLIQRTPRRAMTEMAPIHEMPKYPNQAHSALHSQFYPAYSSDAFQGHRALLGAADSRSARTAGNTPAHTPGLFSLHQAHFTGGYDAGYDESPIPSPYLHPVHRQPVKETLKAVPGTDDAGRKLINQYQILEELGRGVHGKVKLAQDIDTKEYVAIKIVQRYSKRKKLGKPPANPEETVKKEIAILKKCQHPNVVSMIEVIDDPDFKKIYIVLEFCQNHEVDWRTEGNKEIVLLENRRFEKEAKGMSDLKAALKQDKQNEKILKSAAKRREQRPAMPDRAASDYWSLEFGESDYEDDTTDGPSSAPASRTISRVSSIAPEDSKSESGEPPQNLLKDLEINNPLSNQFASESDFGSYQPLIKASERQTSFSQLTGSMHSASDTDDSRGRQASVTESSTSHLTDLLEREVPEDWRFVPVMTLGHCRTVIRDAVLGLEYLHHQGIVHRDIKPANLLRTASEMVKISDFGVSYLGIPVRDGDMSEDASDAEGNDDDETALAKNVGTPAFYAPELCKLEEEVSKKTVTKSIDIWALGITLFCLVFARTPFTAENEFILMRKIAEDDVFIPRKRLKALYREPKTRSKSRGPKSGAMIDKRRSHELAYEDIADDLYDLMKRLLDKDPHKRITLTEVKHHPWILGDISDPVTWLDDTDPYRYSQGIEISQQEVKDAIKPIKIVERAVSLARKVGGAIAGLGGGRSTNRSRSKSGVAHDLGSPTSGPTSAPPTAGPHVREPYRRASARLEDDSAWKSPHEHHDHPLSQSHTASPQASNLLNPFERVDTYNLTLDKGKGKVTSSRPAMPGRQESIAASVRTIRQEDIDRKASHTPSPPPPLSKIASGHLEPHGGSNLGEIFGGASKSMMRAVSRDRHASPQGSPNMQASNDTTVTSDHLHGEPSLAFSNANAAGYMNQPQPQGRFSGRDILHSPTHSRNASRSNRPESPRVNTAILRKSTPSGESSSHGSYTMYGDIPTDEQYRNAMETHNRRRIRELAAESAVSPTSSRPNSSFESRPCPPSPDDETADQQVALKNGSTKRVNQFTSEIEISPQSQAAAGLVPVSSASSEDHITPALSQSTSFPSAPMSVTSAESFFPKQVASDTAKDEAADLSDATTRNTTTVPAPKPFLPLTSEDDDGYVGDRDRAVQSDSDSDSGEDFIVMGRKKSQAAPKPHPQLAKSRDPQSKVSRSGSSSASKK